MPLFPRRSSLMPTELVIISYVTLALGAAAALWIAFDLRRHPQQMAVMNVVWPVCALFGGPLLFWFYLRYGRASPAMESSEQPHAASVAKSALHCGAGCTLGDMIGETMALDPAVLRPFGYPGLFSDRIFAVWILDLVLAFVLGIAFQYFAIRPMRPDLRRVQAITAAVKADTLSLLSWQVGMYGAMAVAIFAIYQPMLGTRPEATSPVFWMTMQVAMLAGLLTAFPANWLLIRRGIKHAM